MKKMNLPGLILFGASVISNEDANQKSDLACIPLEDIPAYKEPLDMADYLQKHYKDFCDKETWWKVVHRSHQISAEIFYEAVKEADTSSAGISDYAIKTWTQVSYLFINIPASDLYSSYVSFDQDNNEPTKVDLITVKEFSSMKSCYSVALFKGIEQKYGVKINELNFHFIELRNIAKVFFKITDSNDVEVGFYDISTDPTLVIIPITEKKK